MTIFARSALVLATVLTVLAFAPNAFAEEKEKEEFEDTIHVIQRKPVLEENRFELTPRFGMSVNDSVYRSFKVGTNANFHISERVYIGGLFEWFDFGTALGGPTKTFEKNFDQTSAAPDAPVVNWFGALEGGFKPIYGKFALFNFSILYYDIGATLGVGYVNAESLTLAAPQGTFGATGSIIARLFLNDWMAFDLELRDLLYPAKLSSGAETVNTIANIVTVSGGVSFYLPTSFEYETPEQESKK